MSDKENINGASLFKDLGINPEDFHYHIESIDLYLKAMIVKELKSLNDGSVLKRKKANDLWQRLDVIEDLVGEIEENPQNEEILDELWNKLFDIYDYVGNNVYFG